MFSKELAPSFATVLRQRVMTLYQRGSASDGQSDLLTQAYEELEIALEALQDAEARLKSRDEDALNQIAALEAEVARYHELFAQAPAAYIITGLDGTIRQANAAARELLQLDEKRLVGRALALFVPEGQRRPFRTEIAQAGASDQVRVWQARLQPWSGDPFDAELIVGVARGRTGRPLALRWLIRAVEGSRLAAADLSAHDGSMDIVAAAPDTDGSGQNERLRQHCAFFAEACLLVAVAYDMETALAHVARLAVPTIADACVIDIPDGSTGRRRLVVTREIGAGDTGAAGQWQRYTPRAPLEVAQMRTRIAGPPDPLSRLIDVAEIQAEPGASLRRSLTALKPTSVVIAPIQARGRTLGSLALICCAPDYCYTQHDAAMAEELARRVGIAVDRLCSAA